MRWTFALIALLAVALNACASAPPAAHPHGDETGDPARGSAYARDVCASCHAVAAGDLQSPNPSAPPFQRVADTPGMTRLALSAWLHSAHPSMPSFVVEDEQIDNLHAYLSSIASR